MTTLRGCYQLVPPPQVGGWGFKKLTRGLKKAGRGVKKVGKGGVKVAKKGAKVASKASMYAIRAAAKLVARPIVRMAKTLAKRRSRYLAFKRTGTTQTTLAERRAGAQYVYGKLQSKGPIGKLAVRILKFAGGATAGALGGGTWRQDAAMCGMSGAEIAAMSAQIMTVINQLKSALNKKGEAPANPAAGAKKPAQDEGEEAAEPAEEPTEEAAEESAEDSGEDESATEGLSLEDQYMMAEETGNRALMKKIATKIRRRRGAGHF
jgi:hypothetical protein